MAAMPSVALPKSLRSMFRVGRLRCRDGRARLGEMAHVCPWWFVRSFDNRFRRRFHEPEALFGRSVRPGSRALDVGCGAGFNTEGLARIVGPHGKVVAVDLQPRMLTMTERRLRRSGLLDRVELVQAEADDLRLESQAPFGFAVAFWMVHEVPDPGRLLRQIGSALAPGGHLMVCEPRLHVTRRAFEKSVEVARQEGFVEHDRPRVAFSRAVVLTQAESRGRLATA